MRNFVCLIIVLGMLCGCAKVCEFGQGTDESGVRCVRLFSRAVVGMTQAQVEKQIGSPQSKRLDIAYRDETYDEAWIYDTQPATILYFKGGVLEHKEYQQ